MAELLDCGGVELRRGSARRGCAVVFVVAAEEGRRVPGGPRAVVKKGRASLARVQCPKH